MYGNDSRGIAARIATNPLIYFHLPLPAAPFPGCQQFLSCFVLAVVWTRLPVKHL